MAAERQLDMIRKKSKYQKKSPTPCSYVHMPLGWVSIIDLWFLSHFHLSTVEMKGLPYHMARIGGSYGKEKMYGFIPIRLP